MEFLSLTDKELVTRYVGGCEASIEVLIRRHQNRLFSYIMSQVKDRDLANDVFQDTFMKAINTIKSGKYNDDGRFVNWVMRIAHNLIMDHYRDSAKIPCIKNSDEFDIFSILKIKEDSVEDKIVAEQINAELKLLVDSLPDEQREVVMMRFYGNMSFKDIAEEIECNINTVLGRMRYAILRIRKTMKEKNIVLSA